MKKKIFGVLLCTTMLICSAAGCKADEKSSNDSTVEQSQSIEYEIIEPPESGWTVETVASTIRLCGKPIELPFTVDSLGEGFKFIDNTGNSGCVSYNGHESFLTAFVKTEKSDDPYKKTVRKISNCEYYSDDDFQNSFTINGVGIGSNKELVIAALGQPDFQTDTAFEYYSNHIKSENYIVRLSFGDLDIVQSMFVNLINE